MAQTYYVDGVLESIDDNGNDIVVKIKQAKGNLKWPDTVTFWGNQTNLEVIRGVGLKKGDQARVIYTHAENLTRGGNPYKDGVRVEPYNGVADPTHGTPTPVYSDDQPPHPADEADEGQTPAPQPEPEPKNESDNRDNGMAYGAAQNAASRTVAAWFIVKGKAPTEDEWPAIAAAATGVTALIFKNRLAV